MAIICFERTSYELGIADLCLTGQVGMASQSRYSNELGTTYWCKFAPSGLSYYEGNLILMLEGRSIKPWIEEPIIFHFLILVWSCI